MSKKSAIKLEKGILPPQNIDAERSLLGAVLLDKNAIFKILDIVDIEDFYRPDHALIFEAMLKLTEKRQPIDVLTLSDNLEKSKKIEDAGGASYISELVAETATSANIVTYAEIVKRDATLRNLISAGSQIVELAFSDEEDADALIDEAEKMLFSVSRHFLKQSFTPIQDILSQTFERIDELHKNKGQLRGVATGYKDIDNLLAGMQPSDLIIIAARPSMGKTTLALNIAVNVAVRGKIGVGIFSLEQSKDQLVDRMLVSEAGVDSWKLRTGNLSDSDFPLIGQAMGVLSEAPVFIDDSPTLNIMEMRAKARRLQAEKGLGLIVIDYLQLMQGKSHSGDSNRVQEISDISRGLKAIARELNVPVIALSQLSRAVEMRHPKIPQLADLRESGCLSGGTLVINPENGTLTPIDKINLKSNNHVNTLTDNLKLKSSLATNVFCTGRKQTYKLTTQSGKIIKATANHKFLTVNGWQRLDGLGTGDYLATPRTVGYLPSGAPLNNDQLILLGHLIGDGCTLARQPIHYTNADLSCHDAVSGAASRMFGISPRLVKQENWYHTYLPSPYRLARGKRSPVAQWFDELGIFNRRSNEKVIPAIMFQQPLSNIGAFISHLWATDGSITRYKLNCWRIYYASSSLELANGLAHLLLRFGIVARLRQNRKLGYEPTWSVDISGSQQQLIFCRKIGVFGQKSNNVKQAIYELSLIAPNTNIDVIPKNIWGEIESRRQEIGWSTRQFHTEMEWAYSGTQRQNNGLSRQRLAKVATVLQSPRLKVLSTSDIFWDQIKSITKDKVESVYDLTVASTHNFVANDIIVHNSIEQDSDVVMFIYREEYYEPSTERKNIADIMVKKHRNGPIGNIELYFVAEQMKFATIEKLRKQDQ